MSRGAEDLTYEQLAAARRSATALLGSGVLFIMDRERTGDVLRRIDTAVQLNRERDAARAERQHDAYPGAGRSGLTREKEI
jgi:hypothetical protein